MQQTEMILVIMKYIEKSMSQIMFCYSYVYVVLICNKLVCLKTIDLLYLNIQQKITYPNCITEAI